MRFVKPHYYDTFQCIADKCPDTCCAGWQIMIDGDTLKKYQSTKTARKEKLYREGSRKKDTASFDEKIANSIDWKEGCFKQINGRCAMLNEKMLCDLIIEKGEAWLCDTCRKYPRHVEEFDGVREMSLSLSCPVAAEILLKREDKMQFLVTEDNCEDPLEEEFEDFDFLLYTQLQDAREVVFSIVQNRDTKLTERMAIIFKMAKEMQECLDEERLFEMEDVIGKYAKGTISTTMYTEEERYAYLKENFALFYELERLRPEWSEVVKQTEDVLYAADYQQYACVHKEFESTFVAEFGKERWEIFLEQILMFFLYTYFCGAVYDDCIYSKVGLAVFSALYIQEFIMCQWYVENKNMTLDTCIRLAYRYAREVEHSDTNLITLEEWLLERM